MTSEKGFFLKLWVKLCCSTNDLSVRTGRYSSRGRKLHVLYILERRTHPGGMWLDRKTFWPRSLASWSCIWSQSICFLAFCWMYVPMLAFTVQYILLRTRITAWPSALNTKRKHTPGYCVKISNYSGHLLTTPTPVINRSTRLKVTDPWIEN